MNVSFNRCWNPFALPSHYYRKGLRPAPSEILERFPEFASKVFCRCCRLQIKNYIGPRIEDANDEGTFSLTHSPIVLDYYIIKVKLLY